MPKYHIEVKEKDVRNRMFKYEITLHDSTRKQIYDFQRDYTQVAVDWCDYKFRIKRTARKLLRKQLEKDNAKRKLELRI